MRVALYTRVSTKDRGQDVANQLGELRRYCAAQDGTVVIEYQDYDSSSYANRAQFQPMLADAAQHRFDLVVFWALDRLSREGALPTLQHLKWLSSHGVAFRSFTGPYLDSVGIFKDVVIAVLGTIAKQERVRMSERVRAGLNRAKLEGTKSGRPIARPQVMFDRDRARARLAQGLQGRGGDRLGLG